MNEPAVASIAKTNAGSKSSWFPGTQNGVLITTFGFATGDGVWAIPNAGSLINATSSTKPIQVDSHIAWPNQAELAPTNAIAGRTVVLEAGGFFANPLKSTGAVTITDVTTDTVLNHKISTDKSGFFYHRAIWMDMNGDGKLDVVAARANVPSIPFEKKVGELIWLEQPTSNPMTGSWTEHVLVSPVGPDVSFNMLQVEGVALPVFVAAQYFDAKQLAMYYCDSTKWSNCGTVSGQTPVKTVVIDSVSGPYFSVSAVDLSGDSKKELLVTSNKDDGTGGVYVYEQPSDPISTAWPKHVLEVGFKPIHFRLPGAGGPGVAQAFYPDLRRVDLKPSILVDGDDNGTVVILTPQSLNAADWGYNISLIETGSGTVGSPAVGDLNGDLYADIVVPVYTDNRVDVWTFFPEAESHIHGRSGARV